MMLNITAIRNTFPDRSQFEGRGVAPDIEVVITLDDLRAGRDRVLAKAIQVAAAQ